MRRPSPPWLRRTASDQRPDQGTAADIIKRAMIRLPGLLGEGRLVGPVLQVHDELFFEVPHAEAETASTLITRVMEEAPPSGEPGVPWWRKRDRAWTCPLVNRHLFSGCDWRSGRMIFTQAFAIVS